MCIRDSCYSAALSLSPENQSVCPLSAVSYTAELKNTGKLPDTYTLRFESSLFSATENVTLASMQSQSFIFRFDVPKNATGSYDIAVSAESEHTSSRIPAALNVEPLEECYSLELKAMEDTVAIGAGEAAVTQIYLKNTGKLESSYSLSAEGPEWIYISPETMHLDSGEEGTIYLYLTPPFGTDSGAYIAGVKASSPYTDSMVTIPITVGAAQPSKPQEEPSENVSINATGEEISLNVTFGENITGFVITGDSEAWKVMVIGAITIIIIIIPVSYTHLTLPTKA